MNNDEAIRSLSRVSQAATRWMEWMHWAGTVGDPDGEMDYIIANLERVAELLLEARQK